MNVIEESGTSLHPALPASENWTPVVGFRSPDVSPQAVVIPSTGYWTLGDPSLSQRTLATLVHVEPMWIGHGSGLGDLTSLLSKIEELADQMRRVQERVESALQVIPEPHLEALHWIKVATGLSQERIGDLLGVSRQTIRNWGEGTPIAGANRRRIFAVRDVLERAAMRYPTKPELANWLDTPHGAEGLTPAQLLAMGRIDEARYWAIADSRFKLTPSKVKRAPVDSSRERARTPRKVGYRDEDEELLALYGRLGGEDEDE